MKIEPIPGGCLRIWLTNEESEEWGVGSGDTDEGRLRRQLRRALSTQGRHPLGRLLVEAIPIDGGSLLLVTPRRKPDGQSPLVLYLPDEDRLLSLWERWRRMPEEGQPMALLYDMGEGYHLAVYPDRALTSRQTHLLLEFGTLLGCGEGAAAHSAEYGRLVAAGDWLTARGRRSPDPEDPRH